MYADEAIKAMLYIRFKLHLSLRELEGFFISLMEISRKTEKVPCYTQVCRRMKSLSLPHKLLSKKGVTDIVLDTTGLKVYGAGEWRAEKYGGKARWMKIHLAIVSKTGKVVLAEATEENKHDTTYLEKALKKANARKGKVLSDGIEDMRRCYELARRHNKELMTRPKKGEIIRREECYGRRNEVIKIIRVLGGDKLAKSIRGKLVGYNRRVLIESSIARWKGIYGGSLRSRSEERIEEEVKIKAIMNNEMIERERAA